MATASGALPSRIAGTTKRDHHQAGRQAEQRERASEPGEQEDHKRTAREQEHRGPALEVV